MNKIYMLKAIEEARCGAKAGDGGPFGSVIVKDGRILASAHNTVLKSNDPTQHAEIKAISMAAAGSGSYDLSGCDIYSTNEPCPMCFSAIHWARISRLFYGTSIEDVRRLGFNEMTLPAEFLKEKGASPVEIRGGCMIEECRKLLKYWESLPDRKVY